MVMGTPGIGEDRGIPGVALAHGGAVARATGPQGVGVDGYDGMAGFDQRVDEQAVGPFDRDRHLWGWGAAGQRAEQARSGMGDGEALHHLPLVIEDAGSVFDAAPVKACEVAHPAPPAPWSKLSSAGRPCW